MGKTILPWPVGYSIRIFNRLNGGPAYLAAGVTTVRDCGNEFGYINAIQKAIDNGSGIGPHILKAGIIDGKGPYALGHYTGRYERKKLLLRLTGMLQMVLCR
jgi:hypothetical protein